MSGHPICTVCGGGESVVFFTSRLDHSVRSDWTPVPVSSVIRCCGSCGHLFKSSDLVGKWSDYEAYRMFEDRPVCDKVEYGAGHPRTRSAAILSHLGKDKAVLNEGTAVLDFGCNRGFFLSLLEGDGHAGFDVSDRYRSLIEGMGRSYFTRRRPPPRSRFDLLTMIHVLEHLQNPAADIRQGLDALKKGGRVFIQVPDSVRQPTDFYIIDHCSHFSSHAMDLLMSKLGFGNAGGVEALIPGEFSGLYRADSNPRVSAAAPKDSLNALKDSLTKNEERLLSFKESGKPCVIFGAGLIGSFLAAILGPQARAFLDDQPELHGTKFGGLPVLSPESPISSGSVVVIAVPPPVVERVREKCLSRGHDVLIPFPSVLNPAHARSNVFGKAKTA